MRSIGRYDGAMDPIDEREIALARQLQRQRRGKRRTSPATAWMSMVIGALIAVMFVPPLIDELRTYRRQAGVAGLPSVTGEVLESRVHVEARRSHRTSVSRHTEPVIRYRYAVNGRSYESSRFAFQEFVLLEDECEAIVAEHPPGSDVEVYYHPDDPALAAISTRPPVLNDFIVILCGAMLLLSGGVVAGGAWARPWEAGADPDEEV